MFAKKLCDLFGGEAEIGSGFEEDRGPAVFFGDEGLWRLARMGNREGKDGLDLRDGRLDERRGVHREWC